MGRQEETGHGAGKQGHAEKNGGGGAVGLRARLGQREGRRAKRRRGEGESQAGENHGPEARLAQFFSKFDFPNTFSNGF